MRGLQWSRKVLEEVVHATAGVDFWRLEEETWWYLGGLLALQVVGREVFKRYGPFKEDAALFVHQVTSSACITVVLALTRISNSAVAGQASSHSGAEECPRKYEKHTKYYNVLAHYVLLRNMQDNSPPRKTFEPVFSTTGRFTLRKQ